VLRTTFQEINGEPFQVISPYSKVELNIIDISHITGEDCEKLALESARNEANRLFDLTKGPLIRFLLICKSQTEHIFVVTVHHIFSMDGLPVFSAMSCRRYIMHSFRVENIIYPNSKCSMQIMSYGSIKT